MERFVQQHRDRPSIVILSHFFIPDDVITAQNCAELAAGLAYRGWNVTVLTSNRFRHRLKVKIIPKKECWKDVFVVRVSRPGWDQSKWIVRIVHSIWILVAWTFVLARMPPCDVIIVNSDPDFSQLIFPFLRLLKRQSFLAFWCQDLFPEALMADTRRVDTKKLFSIIRAVMKRLYRFIDLIIDVGPCMRDKLRYYEFRGLTKTLTPLAQVEATSSRLSDIRMRRKLFGDAELALLYSGTLGRPHDFEPFLRLTKCAHKRNLKIVTCFVCRGNRCSELKKAVKLYDYNIRFAPFAHQMELEQRLKASDFHLISVRPEWKGIVVPSKFFGSLAVGRPVIYAGPEDSSIANWIREYGVGIVLSEANISEVVDHLVHISKSPRMLLQYKRNAHKVYFQHFSKESILSEWDRILRLAFDRY